MPTTGVINGTDLRAYVGSDVVAYATSCTLSLSREIRETIHKDNPGSGWREVEVAGKSGTLTVEALFAEDGTTETPFDLFDALDNGTSLSMMVSTEVTGDTRLSFSAYCTSWELTSAVEENATYNCNFEITGAVTKETTS